MDNTSQCRWSVALDRLRVRLRGGKAARIQVLLGPRQIGKTTLLQRLASEVPGSVYVAADLPEVGLPGWWDVFWADIRRRARAGPLRVMLDEIHLLHRWDQRLKAEWDRIVRDKLPVTVVVAGSSALLVSRGLKESLAGRFEMLRLSHWSAQDLVDELGLADAEATDAVVDWGGYPGAMEFRADPERWRSYVRESIIEPAIGRDILVMEPIRKPALLRQLFFLCAEQPATVVSLQKLAAGLEERGALETLSHYLRILEEAGLVAGLNKWAGRALRRRAAPPKLVVLNNALVRAVQSGTGVPDPARRGAWVENACLAFAWSQGQSVSYWREEPLEVDGILEGSWGRWAIEVKTGRFGRQDLAGLMEFCGRHEEFRPLLLTTESVQVSGVESMTWREFLLKGLA